MYGLHVWMRVVYACNSFTHACMQIVMTCVLTWCGVVCNVKYAMRCVHVSMYSCVHLCDICFCVSIVGSMHGVHGCVMHARNDVYCDVR